MALNPIIQGVCDAFMPPAANEGLRPIGEGLGSVMKQLDGIVAAKQGKTIIQNLADIGQWDAPDYDSERYRMLDRALMLRGMPNRYGGSADGSTFDGWSLVRHCASYAAQRDCADVSRQTYNGWIVSEETEARSILSQWGLAEIKVRHAQPGDVLLFKMPTERKGRTHGLPADEFPGGYHIGIMSAPGGELCWAMQPNKKPVQAKMVHCGLTRPVGECWLGAYWTDNLVAAFSFGDQPNERPALKAVA